MTRNEESLCKIGLVIPSYGSLSKRVLHLFNEGSVLNTKALYYSSRVDVTSNSSGHDRNVSSVRRSGSMESVAVSVEKGAISVRNQGDVN